VAYLRLNVQQVAALHHVENLLVDHASLIDRILAALARRRCFFADEAEDFASWARLRLLEDGETILAKFQGRSSLPTYLTAVVHNLFRDYRIAKWGKWRPSAAARRLGPVGMELERLMGRDGFGFAEAVGLLRRNRGVTATDAELEEMAGRLPGRAPRRFEGEEALERVGVEGGVEEGVLRGEAAAAARRVESALAGALAALASEDRLILKLRIQDGFSVADLARSLHLDQKPLYRRIERLLAGLREDLERRGVTREEVREVVGTEGVDLRVDYGLGGESAGGRPSNGLERR
jgi:RNA polymerase sigma factor for flagellar operon FliA